MLKVEAWSIFTFGMPYLGQNLTNSKSYLVLRSVICQKIAMFEQLNNQISFGLKIKFDPETLPETIESGPLCITDLFQNKSAAYF